jgi:hypothetical protein
MPHCARLCALAGRAPGDERRSCLDTARALVERRRDASRDATRLAVAISDPPVGTPLNKKHFAAGDELMRALFGPGRRPVVERLLDCARTMTTSAHERLEVKEQAADILQRLAEDEEAADDERT